METSSIAAEIRTPDTIEAREARSSFIGLKQSWMLDEPASNVPSGPSPFGSETQTQWERLSPIERLMLFDTASLNAFCVQEIASQTARLTPGMNVVDACCGVGGNAIAFALAGKMVTAIDVDHSRLEMAQFNATLFGVADRIRWIHGDAREIIPWVEADSVFIDPSWEVTPEPSKLLTFDRSTPNGRELARLAQAEGRNVILRLPLQFDFDELSSGPTSVRVSENLLKGDLVGYTAVLHAR